MMTSASRSVRYSQIIIIFVLATESLFCELVAEHTPSKPLADQALSLLKRSIAIGVPESFPKELKGAVERHVVEDYDLLKEDPVAGFSNPALIHRRDRKLYDALVAFWATPAESMLHAAPEIGEAYFREDDVVRHGIAGLLKYIAETTDDIPGRGDILEPVLLRIFESSQDDSDRSQVLQGLRAISIVPGLSSEGTRSIVKVASSRDGESSRLRCDEVSILSGVVIHGTPPDDVVDYVLGIASGHGDCSALAVHDWIVNKYGRDRVLPVYLNALRANVDGPRTKALALIRVVGLVGKYQEALPTLMRCLESSDPMIATEAVSALEAVTGISKSALAYEQAKEKVHDAELDWMVAEGMAKASGSIKSADEFKSEFPPDARVALNEIIEKWKKWWLQNSATSKRVK